MSDPEQEPVLGQDQEALPADEPVVIKITPLAKEDNDEQDPRLVWHSLFDGRYQVEVHRIGEAPTMAHVFTATRPEHVNNAFLHIFDRQNGDELLFSEEVGLSYGSLFGPDVDDVSAWQDRAALFVDAELPIQRAIQQG